MKYAHHRAAKSCTVLLLCSLILAPAAFATNGMNMEGYGPVATGMGGASMAYDNGTAAVMNNPATLSLMKSKARLDLAVGYLGPDVKSSMSGMPDAKSSADAFYMPAFGYVRKGGQITYGLGVFAQGGMGTEYAADSFLAAGSGEKVMSQVAMGRAVIPISFEVNKDLAVAATLDFVWASMDLKMALDGASFGDMVAGLGGSQTFGSASGSLVDTLVGAFTVPQAACGGVPCLSSLSWARFDFADSSDFSGKAKGNGFAGKLGAVYKVNSQFTLGATYHSKTYIGDLEAAGSTLSMNVTGPATLGNPTTIPVTGTIKVKDFQWPQMFGLGGAYQANPKLLLVLDYKWINWKNVMKDFKMNFQADANQASPAAASFGLGGQTLDATMYQNWKDQNVFMLGAGYNFTDEFVGRIGVNIANNPIPDQYENPLFPAIIKNSYMIGAGYAFNKANAVDFSYTYAPEVKVTNGQDITTSHSQNNMQIMYSHLF